MYYLLVAITLYGLALMGGRVNFVGVLVGMGVHLAYIIQRTLTLGDIPVTERLDILSLISFMCMVIFVFEKLKRPKSAVNLELYLVPLACFFGLTSILNEPVNTIDIFMDSPWFYMYSTLMCIAYALLGAGACFGMMYVLGDGEEYAEIHYSYILYGWLALALALLFGSVWFYMAYASYWYWTAREFWLSMTWLYYGGIYLHIRYLKSFSGRPAALIGVLGYPLMLFNYFGIGTLIRSPWSQF